MDETPKTSLFEILIAILLGLGATGGGWAAYQASQWGSTAIEDFGKASKTATEGSTLFNYGVAVATNDLSLDVQAKILVLDAIIAAKTGQPEVTQARNMTVAKYLYLRQMSAQAYTALGLPAEWRAKPKDQQEAMPNDLLVKANDKELGGDYLKAVLTPGAAKFTEADKIFTEGDSLSGRSTKFGQVQMIFTIGLFLAGLALVIKSKLKWTFMIGGYGTFAWATIRLLMLPWY